MQEAVANVRRTRRTAAERPKPAVSRVSQRPRQRRSPTGPRTQCAAPALLQRGGCPRPGSDRGAQARGNRARRAGSGGAASGRGSQAPGGSDEDPRSGRGRSARESRSARRAAASPPSPEALRWQKPNWRKRAARSRTGRSAERPKAATATTTGRRSPAQRPAPRHGSRGRLPALPREDRQTHVARRPQDDDDRDAAAAPGTPASRSPSSASGHPAGQEGRGETRPACKADHHQRARRQQRERSLASLKRQRERLKKQALGMPEQRKRSSAKCSFLRSSPSRSSLTAWPSAPWTSSSS